MINCYKFHGREDLLPAFSEEDEKANQLATLNSSVATTHVSEKLPANTQRTIAISNTLNSFISYTDDTLLNVL